MKRTGISRWALVLAAALAGSCPVGAARAAAAADGSVVVAAVGDIACDPASPAFNGGRGTGDRCRAADTAALVRTGYDAVLALGDLQYEDGKVHAYRSSYALDWGAVKSITHPALGNHDARDHDGSGYRAYFGAVAGTPGHAYSSFDVGAWHVITLDSNCGRVGCGAGSRQARWLRADLAAHSDARCTLAFMHHPFFSSGEHGPRVALAPLVKALYDGGVDVVITGHDHDYERFAPQDPARHADPARGIRAFVVGTGGRSLRPFGTTRANSEVRDSSSYGVLRLVLRPGGYDWRFVAVKGASFADAGSGECH